MPIGILRIYRLLFLCLSVHKIFCKGYLWCGLSQGDEIWQDGRSGWVAGHLSFGELKVTIGPVTAIGMWGYTPVLITGILVIVIGQCGSR